MSEHTAAVAIDTMLVTDMPSEDLGMEMYGLLDAVEFEYERWCRIVGMDPDDPISEDVFDTARNNFARTWVLMGEKPFLATIIPLAQKWRRLLGERGD